MQTDCPASIQACRLRVARLDPTTRAPVSGATAGYVTDAFTEVRFAPEIETGTVIEVKSACGALHNPYRDPDTVKRLTITVILENPDPELHELFTGAGLITSGGNSIGMTGSRIGSAPNHVSLECWSKAVIGGTQAATLPWLHWAFPDVQLQMGEKLMDNAQQLSTFTGFGVESPAAGWANGPFNDWPVSASPLLAPWGVFRDANIPAAACGYTLVPAQ